MSATSVLVALVFAVVLLYTIKAALSPNRKLAALPPGPKRLPVLGNIFDLPPAGVREWEHWLKHKDLYGMNQSHAARAIQARGSMLMQY